MKELNNNCVFWHFTNKLKVSVTISIKKDIYD